MSALFKSKITAWSAMILAIALIVLSLVLHTPWWGFIAIFFLFMSVFTHLMSLYLGKINSRVGSKLEMCALVCIIISIIGFIVEYILFNFVFD